MLDRLLLFTPWTLVAATLVACAAQFGVGLVLRDPVQFPAQIASAAAYVAWIAVSGDRTRRRRETRRQPF